MQIQSKRRTVRQVDRVNATTQKTYFNRGQAFSEAMPRVEHEPACVEPRKIRIQAPNQRDAGLLDDVESLVTEFESMFQNNTKEILDQDPKETYEILKKIMDKKKYPQKYSVVERSMTYSLQKFDDPNYEFQDFFTPKRVPFSSETTAVSSQLPFPIIKEIEDREMPPYAEPMTQMGIGDEACTMRDLQASLQKKNMTQKQKEEFLDTIRDVREHTKPIKFKVRYDKDMHGKLKGINSIKSEDPAIDENKQILERIGQYVQRKRDQGDNESVDYKVRPVNVLQQINQPQVLLSAPRKLYGSLKLNIEDFEHIYWLNQAYLLSNLITLATKVLSKQEANYVKKDIGDGITLLVFSFQRPQLPHHRSIYYMLQSKSVQFVDNKGLTCEPKLRCLKMDKLNQLKDTASMMCSYSVCFNRNTLLYAQIVNYAMSPSQHPALLFSLSWYLNNPNKSDEERWSIILEKCQAPLNSLNTAMVIMSYYFSFSQVPTLQFAEKIFRPPDKNDEHSQIQVSIKLLKGFESNPLKQERDLYLKGVDTEMLEKFKDWLRQNWEHKLFEPGARRDIVQSLERDLRLDQHTLAGSSKSNCSVSVMKKVPGSDLTQIHDYKIRSQENSLTISELFLRESVQQHQGNYLKSVLQAMRDEIPAATVFSKQSQQSPREITVLSAAAKLAVGTVEKIAEILSLRHKYDYIVKEPEKESKVKQLIRDHVNATNGSCLITMDFKSYNQNFLIEVLKAGLVIMEEVLSPDSMIIEFMSIVLDWFTTKVYLIKSKPFRRILEVLLDENNPAHRNYMSRYKDLLPILQERKNEIMERDVLEFPMMHGFGQGLLSILSSVVCSSLTKWLADDYGAANVDLIQTSDDVLIRLEKRGLDEKMAKDFITHMDGQFQRLGMKLSLMKCDFSFTGVTIFNSKVYSMQDGEIHIQDIFRTAQESLCSPNIMDPSQAAEQQYQSDFHNRENNSDKSYQVNQQIGRLIYSQLKSGNILFCEFFSNLYEQMDGQLPSFLSGVNEHSMYNMTKLTHPMIRDLALCTNNFIRGMFLTNLADDQKGFLSHAHVSEISNSKILSIQKLLQETIDTLGKKDLFSLIQVAKVKIKAKSSTRSVKEFQERVGVLMRPTLSIGSTRFSQWYRYNGQRALFLLQQDQFLMKPIVQQFISETLQNQETIGEPMTKYAVLVTPETGEHLRRAKSLEDQLAIYCMLHNIDPSNINPDQAEDIIEFIENEDFDLPTRKMRVYPLSADMKHSLYNDAVLQVPNMFFNDNPAGLIPNQGEILYDYLLRVGGVVGFIVAQPKYWVMGFCVYSYNYGGDECFFFFRDNMYLGCLCRYQVVDRQMYVLKEKTVELGVIIPGIGPVGMPTAQDQIESDLRRIQMKNYSNYRITWKFNSQYEQKNDQTSEPFDKYYPKIPKSVASPSGGTMIPIRRTGHIRTLQIKKEVENTVMDDLYVREEFLSMMVKIVSPYYKMPEMVIDDTLKLEISWFMNRHEQDKWRSAIIVKAKQIHPETVTRQYSTGVEIWYNKNMNYALDRRFRDLIGYSRYLLGTELSLDKSPEDCLKQYQQSYGWRASLTDENIMEPIQETGSLVNSNMYHKTRMQTRVNNNTVSNVNQVIHDVFYAYMDGALREV